MRVPPNIEAQRAYYNARWAEDRHANRLQLERAIAVLQGLQALGLRSPKILDLGCGTGWLTAILARFGPTTGIDLSPVAIERARACHPDVTFIAGDFFEAKIPQGGFDVVVSVQVIEHLDVPSRFVEIVARALRPGGYLILITPNPWNISHWERAEFEEFAGEPQPIEQWLTRRQLISLITPQFQIEQLRTILPGFGRKGIFRVAHSVKLAKVLRSLGLFGLYQKALLRAGFGLVFFAIARRR